MAYYPITMTLYLSTMCNYPIIMIVCSITVLNCIISNIHLPFLCTTFLSQYTSILSQSSTCSIMMSHFPRSCHNASLSIYNGTVLSQHSTLPSHVPLSYHNATCPITMLCSLITVVPCCITVVPRPATWFIVPLQRSTLLSLCFIIPSQYSILPPQYLLSHYRASSFITTFYCPIKAISHHSGPFPHHGPGSYYLQN